MMTTETTNPFRAVAQRIVNAEASFVAYVVEAIGCTTDEATAVVALYRKIKAVKIDAVNGTWHAKHGAFLDVATLKNAVAEVSP